MRLYFCVHYWVALATLHDVRTKLVSFELMPMMPISEKTVLLRECNSDVFSVGYSNPESDRFLIFYKLVHVYCFLSLREENSVPEARTLLREMYVPKFCFHVTHGGSHVINHGIHVIQQPVAWLGL